MVTTKQGMITGCSRLCHSASPLVHMPVKSVHTKSRLSAPALVQLRGRCHKLTTCREGEGERGSGMRLAHAGSRAGFVIRRSLFFGKEDFP